MNPKVEGSATVGRVAGLFCPMAPPPEDEDKSTEDHRGENYSTGVPQAAPNGQIPSFQRSGPNNASSDNPLRSDEIHQSPAGEVTKAVGLVRNSVTVWFDCLRQDEKVEGWSWSKGMS
jgi:hypothetical protein